MRLLEKRKDFTSTAMIDSMTLLMIGRKLIELLRRRSVFAHFLYNAVMLVDFQQMEDDLGPRTNDSVTKAERGCARAAEQVLRTLT